MSQSFIRGYCVGGIMAAVLIGAVMLGHWWAYGNTVLGTLGAAHWAVAFTLTYLWARTDIHP